MRVKWRCVSIVVVPILRNDRFVRDVVLGTAAMPGLVETLQSGAIVVINA